jgi:hypothetical protein
MKKQNHIEHQIVQSYQLLKRGLRVELGGKELVEVEIGYSNQNKSMKEDTRERESIRYMGKEGI